MIKACSWLNSNAPWEKICTVNGGLLLAWHACSGHLFLWNVATLYFRFTSEHSILLLCFKPELHQSLKQDTENLETLQSRLRLPGCMIIFSFRKRGEGLWDMRNKFHMCEKADKTQEGPSPRLEKQEASAGGGGCDQPTCQVRVSDKPSCADSTRAAGFVS